MFRSRSTMIVCCHIQEGVVLVTVYRSRCCRLHSGDGANSAAALGAVTCWWSSASDILGALQHEDSEGSQSTEASDSPSMDAESEGAVEARSMDEHSRLLLQLLSRSGGEATRGGEPRGEDVLLGVVAELTSVEMVEVRSWWMECAKKQMERLQALPSRHSWVRKRSGCIHSSNTPWE